MAKILTHFVYPPIPDRRFDWSAWYDDIGEEGPSGSGRTKDEAIADLLENHPRDNEPNAHVSEPFRSLINSFARL